MARRKHQPQRTCVVCRTTGAKRTLTRLVRTPEGVKIDSSGKLAGRGAYLCDNPACWQKAARSDAVGRALRTTLTEEERALIAAHGAQVASLTENES